MLARLFDAGSIGSVQSAPGSGDPGAWILDIALVVADVLIPVILH